MSKHKKRKDVPQESAPEPTTDTGGYILPASLISSFTMRFADGHFFASTREGGATAPSLRDATAAQIADLTGDFDGEGGEELPKPPADLTTYRDAFASAASKCDHRDAIELLYGREWLCETCGRILDREAMRRARPRSIWDMFGG